MENRIEKSDLLAKLFSFQRFGIKPGLERTEKLLKFLGNPQKFFPAVHVAGTNGKGSVCSILTSVLMEAGYKVGLYTSPHIVSFNERIRINGIEISHEELVDYTKILLPEAEEIGCTFFEINTALAFMHFASHRVDVAVIETGMGGRFDSTNVLSPLLSVITQIDLDHMGYLGDTLADIASEKAGIMKNDTVTVIAKQHPKLNQLFKELSIDANSKIIFADNLFFGKIKEFLPDITMKVEINGANNKKCFFNPGFAGKHQLNNLITALAALNYLKGNFKISQENTENGLKYIIKNTGLHARIELLRANPPVIIDVAHNPSAVKALLETLSDCGYGTIQWNIIFAAMADKEVRKILSILKNNCAKLIITTPKIDRAMSLKKLAEIAKRLEFKFIEPFQEVSDAVLFALSENIPTLCVGSFYLAGEALPVLKEKLSNG